MLERRRAQRYSLIIAAELTEVKSGAKLTGRASDIGRYGCYIDTLNPSLPGSMVVLRLIHAGETFQTNAKVVFVSPGFGMGVAFEDIPPKQLELLDRWLASAVSVG